MKKFRKNIKKLTDIPNVGKATEGDFKVLGINSPEELIGKEPYEMHAKLCELTGVKHDVCVIDVFISAVRYMEGGPPKKWWEYTSERKQTLSQ